MLCRETNWALRAEKGGFHRKRERWVLRKERKVAKIPQGDVDGGGMIVYGRRFVIRAISTNGFPISSSLFCRRGGEGVGCEKEP